MRYDAMQSFEIDEDGIGINRKYTPAHSNKHEQTHTQTERNNNSFCWEISADMWNAKIQWLRRRWRRWRRPNSIFTFCPESSPGRVLRFSEYFMYSVWQRKNRKMCVPKKHFINELKEYCARGTTTSNLHAQICRNGNRSWWIRSERTTIIIMSICTSCMSLCFAVVTAIMTIFSDSISEEEDFFFSVITLYHSCFHIRCGSRDGERKRMQRRREKNHKHLLLRSDVFRFFFLHVIAWLVPFVIGMAA